MPAGLVGSLGGKYPDSAVLLDDKDWGEKGLQGWTQLHDSTNGWSGPVGIEPLGHGGGETLTITTKNGSSPRESAATAIKRISHVGNVYDLEVWWAWRNINTINGVRAIDFGLDNALADGTRYYMKYRWGHYTNSVRDNSGSWSRTNKLQVVAADALYTDIATISGAPSGTAPSTFGIYPAGVNENKSDMNYFRGRFDIGNAQYLGCIFGRDGYGCFAKAGGTIVDLTGSGDATGFKALTTGPPAPAASFAYGLNPSIDLIGRIDTTVNEATVNIARVRLSVVS